MTEIHHRLPITTRGGTDPLWGRDGKKLFYVKPATGELISVPVIPGNPSQFGAHSRIYPGPLEYPTAHSYDLDPKSDRIVVLHPVSREETSPYCSTGHRLQIDSPTCRDRLSKCWILGA